MQDPQDVLTNYLIPTVVEQSSRGEPVSYTHLTLPTKA